MKKKALLLVLVLVLSLALTSCSDILLLLPTQPKDAFELYEKTSAKMSLISSYEAKMTMNLDFKSSAGVKITGEVLNHSIINNSLFNYYAYDSSRQEIKVGTEEITTESIVAYDGGKMYVLSNYGDAYSKIYSAINKGDFKDYNEYSSNDLELEDYLEGAFTQEFTKNDDGGYHILFSDFTKEDAKEIADNVGLKEEVFGIKISEVDIEFEVDKKFRCTEILISFYTLAKEEPITTAKISYYNFGSIEKANIDTDEYKEVDDARVYGLIERSLDRKTDLESGKFTLSSTQTAYVNNGNEKELYSERSEATYKNEDDKFSFHLDLKASGTKATLAYENGKLKTTVGTQSETTTMTDKEAKLMIDQIIVLGSGLGNIVVTDVDETSEGKYKLKAQSGDTSEYQTALSAIGYGNYLEHDISILVEFEEGELVKLEYTVLIKGSKGNISVDNVLTFESTESDDPEGGTKV